MIELQNALMFAAVFVFVVIGLGAAVAVLCIATDGRTAMLKCRSESHPSLLVAVCGGEPHVTDDDRLRESRHLPRPPVISRH